MAEVPVARLRLGAFAVKFVEPSFRVCRKRLKRGKNVSPALAKGSVNVQLFRHFDARFQRFTGQLEIERGVNAY
jgi:hypothetical protein